MYDLVYTLINLFLEIRLVSSNHCNYIQLRYQQRPPCRPAHKLQRQPYHPKSRPLSLLLIPRSSLWHLYVAVIAISLIYSAFCSCHVISPLDDEACMQFCMYAVIHFCTFMCANCLNNKNVPCLHVLILIPVTEG
jgi:hypothetical protein